MNEAVPATLPLVTASFSLGQIQRDVFGEHVAFHVHCAFDEAGTPVSLRKHVEGAE